MLQRTVVYSGLSVAIPNQTFFSHEALQKNATYTIDELIYRSIVYSDNVASQVLYEYLGQAFPNGLLSQTYRDLGILEMKSDITLAAVNTKGYGSIFRMLYNASFLDTEMSEKLLSLLVQSDFQDGIRQGVPGDIAVADKFGERYLDNGEKQLHSCGIIYYPGNPYQLCVMTEGTDFEELKIIIGDISKAVYQEVDSRRIR